VVGDGKWLTTGEVVKALREAGYDESEQTVRRMIDAGKLDAYRTEAGGHRRVTAKSVEVLIAARRRGEDSAAEPGA
jgi:excisionase family DNA binding protein